jgi:hypothetical protein
MSRLMLLCTWLCAMAFVVVAANPARAVCCYNVTYVSNTGSDSNICQTPATACATFAGALTETSAYGEIDCVNAGNYGYDFTVAQSITIDCAGGVGSSFGQITVSGAGIVVRLRNLSLNRFGTGLFGIDAQKMAALYIENCIIANFNPDEVNNGPFLGIKFEPSANAQLFVTGTVISENGNSGSISGGLYIVPASGVTATVSIDRSQINGNIFGIIADGTGGGIIKGTITDSVVSGNAQNGITVSSTGSSVVFQVDRTTVASNANHGLAAAGSGAGMLVSNSNVFNNAGGLFTQSGGALYSYGNNHVNGNNGNDGTFTGTISQQ